MPRHNRPNVASASQHNHCNHCTHEPTSLPFAQAAVYAALEYSTEPHNGWGTDNRLKVLCLVQQAQYSVRQDMVKLQSANDALELALLSLQKLEEITVSTTTN